MGVQAEKQGAARPSKAPTVLLVLAALYSVALVVAAFVVPIYRSSTTEVAADGTEVAVDRAATIAEVNGAWGVVVMAIPLLVTALIVLGRRVLRPTPATITGGVLVVLLFVFCAVGAASVGLYLLPAAVLLGATLVTSGSVAA